MKVTTFNLTDRAAAIAAGWQKNRQGSRILSRLIEQYADRDMVCHAKIGDRRKLAGNWCEKTEDGWVVVE